jgi:hypothetical protein
MRLSDSAMDSERNSETYAGKPPTPTTVNVQRTETCPGGDDRSDYMNKIVNFRFGLQRRDDDGTYCTSKC